VRWRHKNQIIKGAKSQRRKKIDGGEKKTTAIQQHNNGAARFGSNAQVYSANWSAWWRWHLHEAKPCLKRKMQISFEMSLSVWFAISLASCHSWSVCICCRAVLQTRITLRRNKQSGVVALRVRQWFVSSGHGKMSSATWWGVADPRDCCYWARSRDTPLRLQAMPAKLSLETSALNTRTQPKVNFL
jgi:hypothetical protein